MPEMIVFLMDHARGALVGLSVGDALGTTLEFTARDHMPEQTEMTGGGPFHLDPGVWTDDTSLALALAESLVTCRTFDADDVMRRFVRWWQHGQYSPTGRCFDIGNTTARALGRYCATGNPIAGSTDAGEAGNGSLMRLTPAAIFTWNDPDFCRTLAAEQSRTTHGAAQAVDSCMFLADLLRRAMLGEAKDSLLAPQSFAGVPAVQALAEGSWRGKTRDAIRSTGYVIDTLEAALWAVAQTDSFEAAVILAVNLGDDADTVGAVTGQLAGAIYGISAIPPRWLAKLAWRDDIISAADDLLTARRRHVVRASPTSV